METEAAIRRNCVYMVVDIRGFSTWYTRDAEAEAGAAELIIPSLWRIVEQVLPSAHIKRTGDGALITLALADTLSNDDAVRLLANMNTITHRFRSVCNEVGRRLGERFDFPIGWGVARGIGIYFPDYDDYLGRHVNKAFRLCDLARPSGIVLDSRDFQVLDRRAHGLRRLPAFIRGFGSVEVLVTQTVKVKEA